MNKLLAVILASCFIFSLLFGLSVQKDIPEKPPVKIPYKITRTYPHPPGSFTQGLVFEDGFLYEGTGQYGSSSLRKIKLETGEILKEIGLPREIFGEGITIHKNRIIQLTWFSQIGFVYDKTSFRQIKTFRYPVSIEGWGITTDGNHLILSDGSNILYFLDPESFEVINQLNVQNHLGSVQKINELEYVDGAIYANIWQLPKIIKINVDSGKVTGVIDLSNIVPKQFRGHSDYVLNGIAYDSEKNRFLVTGKMWPYVFEMKLLVSE
ncbi:MAG: glutaminyl-peptide cyclotransferase [Candidatus Aminicenantes bacterium]|nr:MAG: glutaminyl-peptide cyclotransferase [Candidatus Aminicenantes bacterium]